jgi:hypothetical protein
MLNIAEERQLRIRVSIERHARELASAAYAVREVMEYAEDISPYALNDLRAARIKVAAVLNVIDGLMLRAGAA